MLIIPVLHGMNTDDPSYLVAFEAKSGKVLWKVERPTDGKNEAPDAYTTPIPMKVGDRTEIIISGGDYLTGHDPKTGKELWRCGGLNPDRDEWFRAVCSPAIVGNMIFAAIKSGPLVACRGGGKGLVTETHLAWTNKYGCDVPTPVSDGKYLYVVNDAGFISCYEPETGKALYERERLPAGTYTSSPLYGDGKIYVTSEKALTTVIAAGPEYKVLSENPLDDDYTLSSIAVAGSDFLLRTSTHLYCIGAK
jgi:outer membrane protein assembly factor BamB